MMWKPKKKTRRALWLSLPSAKAARRKLDAAPSPKRVRPISPAQALRLRAYRDAVNSFRASHPDNLVCAVCLKQGRRNNNIENHHIKGRGKYMCDTSTFLSVCRNHHNEIHLKPAWAFLQGYMLPRT